MGYADRDEALDERLFGISRPKPWFNFVGTFGGENTYECSLCKALTRDQGQHTEWHLDIGH